MNKDIENYVEEFAIYLQKLNKSINTIKRYKLAVKELYKHSNKTPKTVTINDIENYVASIRNSLKYDNCKTQNSGLKKYIQYLKIKHNNPTYDEYLKQKSISDDDIFKVTTKPRTIRDKEIFTTDEVKAILEKAKSHPRNHAIILLFYYSWQRRGSIVNLNVQDIDFEGQINPLDKKTYHKIQIKGAKHNQTYDIYVEHVVIKAIKNYLEVREKPVEGYKTDNYGRKLYHTDAVFLNGCGKRIAGQSLNHFIKNYCIQCGIKKARIHSHMFRRSGISIADSKNVPLSQIMARSGHTAIDSVNPYLNARTDETNNNISSALSLDIDTAVKPNTTIPTDMDKINDIVQKLQQENKELKERLSKDSMTYI